MEKIVASPALTRKAALEFGVPRYFNGKPCPKGHVAERNAKTGRCIECKRAHDRDVRAADPIPMRDRIKDWKEKNSERHAENRRKSVRIWVRRHPEKAAALRIARGRAEKRAIVAWADQEKIKIVYQLRNDLNRLGQDKWHVDHIVPLKSEIVCGLHNEFNIQVIRASDNNKKSNKFWPDMPLDEVAA